MFLTTQDIDTAIYIFTFLSLRDLTNVFRVNQCAMRLSYNDKLWVFITDKYYPTSKGYKHLATSNRNWFIQVYRCKNKDVRNFRGVNWVAANGYLEILKWEKGCNNIKPEIECVNWIIIHGHLNVLKWLFDENLIHFNEFDTRKKMIPKWLLTAASKNKIDILEFLFSKYGECYKYLKMIRNIASYNEQLIEFCDTNTKKLSH